ncbi:D-hexose-6-phosphate mutarotase [Pseudomonas benzenivorans]|uniref:Putative glucose-6-phosphate 1-epimerase n=1 Tax=Pseudomonas benzenivorans TaxID=556533 RepID=A0ABY5H5G9_9PSED|nr:D-hexose-6-phosphate mutarotase [Pseudomonas benzenivorans]UTW07557.1 D-hexose-6-phosphate mutarotase [Pseudomonas benzenivorans]
MPSLRSRLQSGLPQGEPAAQPGGTAGHPLAELFLQADSSALRWVHHQGRELLLIEHPLCRAAFSRQGAQLLHFQPSGDQPWLWCASRWQPHGPVRGGVPICWPWFGRHPTESGWPSHGWARLSDWQLLSSEVQAQGVSLRWQLELCDWQVTLEAELGEAMSLRLVTRHADSEPCQLSHALHAYWRVGDVARVALLGLEGAWGHDLLSRSDCLQQGELRIEDGCHRIFRRAGLLQLQDLEWQRRLLLDTGGGANSVVWHPGSRPLTDVGWNEALGFLCVEAASCGLDSLSLQAGEEGALRLYARRG